MNQLIMLLGVFLILAVFAIGVTAMIAVVWVVVRRDRAYIEYMKSKRGKPAASGREETR